jgi:hypothetical protein
MSATATVNLSEIAARWRVARRLYPIYSALDRQFGLGVEPCRDLEIPINRAEGDVLQRVAAWFDLMDEKIEVWQLRQLLQTSHIADADSLRALLKRQLDAPEKTPAVRDKVDYLLVQYYAQCAPADAHMRELTFDHVANVVEHALGNVRSELPAFCDDLQVIFQDLSACASLRDLLTKRIIERAREVKQRAGGDYFLPPVLVEFARFNFLVRTGFFRLMHADLHAVRVAIDQLEARGQAVCDCATAGLSSQESLADLRRICAEWKKPFREAYSAGNNFQRLIAIRAAVEAAVRAPIPAAPAVPRTAPPEDLPDAVSNSSLHGEMAATVGETKVSNEGTAPAGNSCNVEEYLEKIAEQLLSTPRSEMSVSNITMQETKLLLASWEVAAFTRGGDDISDALQRAVAARAIMGIAVDRKKKGESGDIRDAIGMAHAEAARMQEHIARAKDAKNIDAAVNLAATHKRLLSLVAEAEKL